jgi:hypothetical protein
MEGVVCSNIKLQLNNVFICFPREKGKVVLGSTLLYAYQGGLNMNKIRKARAK